MLFSLGLPNSLSHWALKGHPHWAVQARTLRGSLWLPLALKVPGAPLPRAPSLRGAAHNSPLASPRFALTERGSRACASDWGAGASTAGAGDPPGAASIAQLLRPRPGPWAVIVRGEGGSGSGRGEGPAGP